MSADLVLFDPETIIDKNSYMEPKVYPEGIKIVWVMGKIKFNLLRFNSSQFCCEEIH